MKELLGYRNGINFGGWLSQCDYSEDRLNNFIKEEDFKKVSDWGFDHVRIPADYNIFQNDDLTTSFLYDLNWLNTGFSISPFMLPLKDKIFLRNNIYILVEHISK